MEKRAERYFESCKNIKFFWEVEKAQAGNLLKQLKYAGGFIDTLYETNNGLEEDAEGYREYFACAFKVEKIIKNTGDKSLKQGQLIEISECDKPTDRIGGWHNYLEIWGG